MIYVMRSREAIALLSFWLIIATLVAARIVLHDQAGPPAPRPAHAAWLQPL
jgi:hypothetical protein